MDRFFFIAGSVSAFLGVALGAFAAPLVTDLAPAQLLPEEPREPPRARALMSDQFCRCATGKNGLMVRVPAFEEYEAVVIE